MYKYDFLELRRDCPQSGKALPKDVNHLVEKWVQFLKSERLSKMLKDVREKKLYGEGMYLKGGVMLAKFSFQHGVCQMMKLVRDYSVDSLKVLIESDAREDVLFERTIKNEDISFRRPKES